MLEQTTTMNKERLDVTWHSYCRALNCDCDDVHRTLRCQAIVRRATVWLGRFIVTSDWQLEDSCAMLKTEHGLGADQLFADLQPINVNIPSSTLLGMLKS